MSTITINDGAMVTKDPGDIKVYTFDWDTLNLAAAVTIVSSVWTITPLAPSTIDVALTKDQAAILTGSRLTQIRLSAGTLGQLYEITNAVVTSETPAQTKERSFKVLVQQR